MGFLLDWVKDNWFSLLQGVGIVSGLFFTAVSLNRDARGRRISNILSLVQQHRELWSQLFERPDLLRVVQTEADLVQVPITSAEEEFLNLVFIHFHTGWQIAESGSEVELHVLRKDVRSFFSRPLAREVWARTKSERNPEFVRFVEDCLSNQPVN